jgi:hypothetical protein
MVMHPRSTLGLLLAVAALLGGRPVAAQDPHAGQASQATPATAYEPTRLGDGQPDIRGVWGAQPTGTFDLMDPKTGGGRIQELIDVAAGRPRTAKPSRIVDPPDGRIPYLPWAAAHQAETRRHVDHPTRREHIDPQARCLPGAVPRSFFHSENMILQPPGYVVFLTRNNHASRIVPLDGRPPLPDGIKLWMGDSRGRWEGNTLVIEVRNQNGKGRFDMVGNFATDNLYLEERWTIVDRDTLDYRATFHDAAAYTRPWTVAARAVREAPSAEEYGNEFWEDACHEGERSADEMVLSPDAAAGAAPQSTGAAR